MVGINTSEALYYFKSKPLASIPELTVSRLKGKDKMPIGTQGFPEEPCDVLIPILMDEIKADPEIRSAVLAGWRKAYGEVIALLENIPNDLEKPFESLIKSLCRVVEISHPRELKGPISRLLSVIIDNRKEKNNDETLYVILSAYRSYNRTLGDLELIDYLLKTEEFAAAAFQMLLEIKPLPEQKIIEDRLFELWCNRYEKNWKTDVAYLSFHLQSQEQMRNGEELIIRVMKRIKDYSPDIWNKMYRELKELGDEGDNWANDWLSKVECDHALYQGKLYNTIREFLKNKSDQLSNINCYEVIKRTDDLYLQNSRGNLLIPLEEFSKSKNLLTAKENEIYGKLIHLDKEVKDDSHNQTLGTLSYPFYSSEENNITESENTTRTLH